MKIIWTQNAIDQLQKNVDYLVKEWGQDVTDNFLDELDATLHRLSSGLISGMLDKITGYHKFLVVKQITLYYKIENQTFYIIYVWNNYQKPLE